MVEYLFRDIILCIRFDLYAKTTETVRVYEWRRLAEWMHPWLLVRRRENANRARTFSPVRGENQRRNQRADTNARVSWIDRFIAVTAKVSSGGRRVRSLDAGVSATQVSYGEHLNVIFVQTQNKDGSRVSVRINIVHQKRINDKNILVHTISLL